MRAIAIAVLLSVACSDPPNTQRVPVGSRCGSNDDCGTSPFTCVFVGHPGGYCQKPCTTDGDCPADAACAAGECRRKCTATAQCRATEGYTCLSESGATSMVCDYVAP
jgi:hypothetical protein